MPLVAIFPALRCWLGAHQVYQVRARIARDGIVAAAMGDTTLQRRASDYETDEWSPDKSTWAQARARAHIQLSRRTRAPAMRPPACLPRMRPPDCLPLMDPPVSRRSTSCRARSPA